MDKELCLSSEAVNKHPFITDIVKAANKVDSKHLLKTLDYCIYKIILTEKGNMRSDSIEYEKCTESVNTKVSEELKNNIIKLSDIRGIGASTFMRQAAEFCIDFLYKDVKPIEKGETQ